MSPHAVAGFPSGFWSGLERKIILKGTFSETLIYTKLKARVHTSQPLLHMFSVRSQVPRCQNHQRTESLSPGKA